MHTDTIRQRPDCDYRSNELHYDAENEQNKEEKNYRNSNCKTNDVKHSLRKRKMRKTEDVFLHLAVQMG